MYPAPFLILLVILLILLSCFLVSLFSCFLAFLSGALGSVLESLLKIVSKSAWETSSRSSARFLQFSDFFTEVSEILQSIWVQYSIFSPDFPAFPHPGLSDFGNLPAGRQSFAPPVDEITHTSPCQHSSHHFVIPPRPPAGIFECPAILPASQFPTPRRQPKAQEGSGRLPLPSQTMEEKISHSPGRLPSVLLVRL